MKMRQNLDPSLIGIFECRLLKNSNTNSLRYHTLESEQNYPSYGIWKFSFGFPFWNPLEILKKSNMKMR